MKECTLCPRKCRADRDGGRVGFCGVTSKMRIARAAPHFFEEPCLSGEKGAGTIFFSGCSLGCVYCQNYDVSHRAKGYEITEDELYDLMFSLKDQGVHCIDLVTPTHFADKIIPVLEKAKPTLDIPIVWNCGGYESVETLKMLDGLVDVYLPDFKYASPELAKIYSGAADYPKVARSALAEMYRQVGKFEADENGIAKKGVIVRHLVLPSHRKDTEEVLKIIVKTLPVQDIRLSLMSQYTPEFLHGDFRELARRVTTFEYNRAVDTAIALGFEGYFQERSSASAAYTPDFSDKK